MKFSEVPRGMRPVQCQLCGDFLAAAPSQTGPEAAEMIVNHLALCPAVNRTPTREQDR